MSLTLCSMLFASLMILSPAHAEKMTESEMSLPAIAKTAKDIQPIRVGELAPRFTIQTVENTPYVFDPKTLKQPSLIITYRGGWCPYCNTQLQDLRKVLPEIRELGVNTLFLSGDRPEILHSSLSGETQEAIKGLNYTIYSDANMNAARRLGIAFEAKGLINRLVKFAKDTKASSLELHNALAVPAVILIDKEGTVKYVYTNPDYKVRMPADELLATVKSLISSPKVM
ncbi:peroxiredoxin-like family protein [Marinibactrum halimedae]|nr:peroxiredoxin-like family protein [Marinibactrum halimedae]MCD9460069.1 AhpC/TSA family protein [Marinibactrum halimedae]